MKVPVRLFLRFAASAFVAAMTAFSAVSQADAKTITAVMHSDLRVINPLFTT